MRTTHWRSQATVDPYAECEREPFENPFTSDDPRHKKYENRTVYRPYTRKTDWMNLIRLRRGLSRGAAAGCSQGREPLETVINDHKAPEGRQVLCVPVAPPGLLRLWDQQPGARAPGYILSSLRDWRRRRSSASITNSYWIELLGVVMPKTVADPSLEASTLSSVSGVEKVFRPGQRAEANEIMVRQ
jgi:hypothetical protein